MSDSSEQFNRLRHTHRLRFLGRGSALFPAGLLLLGLTALILRIVALVFNDVVTPDGYYYAALAKGFVTGRLPGEFAVSWPPLYPALIALFSPVFREPELAGRAVSLLAGCALLAPTYWLVKGSFGHRVALIAAGLVAAHPLLVYFSVQFLTEATHTLLFTGAVYAGWAALVRGRLKYFFLTGALFGADYLTRHEAFGYILPMAALTLAGGRFVRRVGAGRTLLNLGALLLGFTFLALPYLVYIRRETGAWGISGKAASHILGSPRYRDAVTGEPRSGLSDNPPPKVLLSRLAKSAKRQFQLLNMVFPLHFVLLAGLGLFRRHWTRGRLIKELYLSVFVAASLLGYVLAVPNVRFLVPLLPILLRWVAAGVSELVVWGLGSEARVRGKRPKGAKWRDAANAGAVVLLTLSMAPLFVYLLEGDKNINYRWQKQAGVWIREQAGGREPLIMARSPLTSFYSGGRYVYLPAVELREVVEAARSKGVDFVVFSERQAGQPSPTPSDENDFAASGLCLERVFGKEQGYRVSVYRPHAAGPCP